MEIPSYIPRFCIGKIHPLHSVSPIDFFQDMPLGFFRDSLKGTFL